MREKTEVKAVIERISSMKDNGQDILHIWIKANGQILQQNGRLEKEKGKGVDVKEGGEMA